MQRKPFIVALLVVLIAFVFYLFFQAKGIYGGDSGDLVTAAVTFGVPHPPGYPLYTFLGWLLNHIPVATPAWRVGLLSSIPHSIALGVLFLLVHHITKRLVAALFATAFLAFNYLFFLYSTTQEVFALFDLFVILLAYLLYRWTETNDERFLLAASFVFGLSLTHHHVILFLAPAILYLVWSRLSLRGVTRRSNLVKSERSPRRQNGLAMTIVFLLGLLPYLYIPIAARGDSIINWDRAVDVPNFIRLITRADYGTFLSNSYYGTTLTQRLLEVKAYGEFVFMDLQIPGILLLLAGFYYIFRQKRALFWFLTTGLFFIGPFFYFYASFPLINRFTLGTYERFLLPSYVLFAPIIGCGFVQMMGWGKLFISPSGLRSIFSCGIASILFLYPLLHAAQSVKKFIGLTDDETAQIMARDILTHIPAGSILLLRSDTPLFPTLYVRYGLRYRPDIAVIHATKLETDEYPLTLSRLFPELLYPPKKPPMSYSNEFIRVNSTKRKIYTNITFPLDSGWHWVPYGLVYQAVSTRRLPKVATYIEENDRIWQTLHNPSKGILSRYNHLMLSDVRDFYAQARIMYGKLLLRAGQIAKAKHQFSQAITLDGDGTLPIAYREQGLASLFLGHCDEAMHSFAQAKILDPTQNKDILYFEAITARDCLKNVESASKLFLEYQREKQQSDIPLALPQ